MAQHIATLEKKKPVALIGDLNVAPLDADIWNFDAKHIPKSAGTTPRERENYRRLIGAGSEEEEKDPLATVMCDAFRAVHAEATGCFSYWSVRAGNKPLNRGLRLDHALVSASIARGDSSVGLLDCQLFPDFAPSGDHCPIALYLC